jgi:hypothetical protein
MGETRLAQRLGNSRNRPLRDHFQDRQLPARPSAEEMRHFQEIAKRYGFWNATAEENTEVGLCLRCDLAPLAPAAA